MKFCPGEECQHYYNATKYPRKCFYERQCWRGQLDLLIALIASRFNRQTDGRSSHELHSLDEMVQSGASLEQIADELRVDREKLTGLLLKQHGSTQGVITTRDLARQACLTRSYISKLERRGIIQPVKIADRGDRLWSPETVATIIIFRDKNRKRCRICNRPVPSDRRVYCSEACRIEGRRFEYQPDAVRQRHKERTLEWAKAHPEMVREIHRRAYQKYWSKKSLQRYQTTEYVIRCSNCPIPLGTTVRVRSRTGGWRLSVEWGEQVVDIPASCLKRKSSS